MNIIIHIQNQKDLFKNIKPLLINGLQKKMKNSPSGSLIDSDLRYLENMLRIFTILTMVSYLVIIEKEKI
jgi:hypothetical protein